jgi:flagellar hook-basal body complex protein FliE
MIPPISGAISGVLGPLGPAEWSVPSTAQIAADTQGTAGTAAVSSTGQSFGSALTNAISSLEQSQVTGSNAAQALATGQATDPTQAVTAVENASLEMQLASQVRNKLDEAATTIFQTQV